MKFFLNKLRFFNLHHKKKIKVQIRNERRMDRKKRVFVARLYCVLETVFDWSTKSFDKDKQKKHIVIEVNIIFFSFRSRFRGNF